MHFIQKTMLGATDFYLHYHDYPKEMAELVEALEPVYNQLIEILAQSPNAKVVVIGSGKSGLPIILGKD